MPELKGATAWINGQRTREGLIGNKLTLFHIWSVSCGLCKESLPKINQLRDTYASRMNVIAVHLPRTPDDYNVELVKMNVRQYQMTQPVCIDNDLKLSNMFGHQFVPAYYIFDEAGKLRHYQAGRSSMVMLEQRILRLLD